LLPALTQTNLAEPLALTYTTPPLTTALLSAGPSSLQLRLSSTAPETDLWAVIADVWPDGSSHPIATGRLRSSFPEVIRGRSLIDRQGDVVQPYGNYSTTTNARAGVERTYQIEFWPIGDRFAPGHRIRLVILGASAASAPVAPALNTVRVGGPAGSRLLFPVLPRR
jgi:hypothetical protein